MERVKLFMGRLKRAEPASNPEGAIQLINKHMDAVEDLYSGVAKSPNAIKMPNIDDGRMYGILDNKYVKMLPDGTVKAFIRKNVIIIDKNGGFKLYTRNRANKEQNQIGKLLLEKAGKK